MITPSKTKTNKILKWFLIVVGVFIVLIIALGIYFHLIPRIFLIQKMKDGALVGEMVLPWSVGEGEGYAGELSPMSRFACKPGLTAILDSTYIGGESGCAIPMCDCGICTRCGDGVCGKGENHCNCPKDCKVGEGIYVEPSYPTINSMGIVGNTLELGGRIKGTWFSEGQLPAKLLDAKGNIVSEGIAAARGEWMTEDKVQFDVSFPNTNIRSGTLLFSKDNPSGQPQNAESVSIPFSF